MRVKREYAPVQSLTTEALNKLLKPSLRSAFKITAIGRKWIHGEVRIKFPVNLTAPALGTWLVDKDFTNTFKYKRAVALDTEPFMQVGYNEFRIRVKMLLDLADPLTKITLLAKGKKLRRTAFLKKKRRRG